MSMASTSGSSPGRRLKTRSGYGGRLGPRRRRRRLGADRLRVDPELLVQVLALRLEARELTAHLLRGPAVAVGCELLLELAQADRLVGDQLRAGGAPGG